MTAVDGESDRHLSRIDRAHSKAHEANTTTSDPGQYIQSLEAQEQPCYVRALFTFESSEISSLNFQEGDLIRVYTKLESGWWDGFLRGERGWFPSNYVEEVELVTDEQDDIDANDDDSDEENQNQTSHENGGRPFPALDNAVGSDDLADRLKQKLVIAKHNKPSGPIEHDSIPVSGFHSPPEDMDRVKNGVNQEVEEDEGFETEITMQFDDESEAAYWIPQTTEDGRIYFFNTVSGVSKWDLPLTPLSSVMTSRAIHTFQTPITTGLRAPEDEPNKAATDRYPTSNEDRNSSTSSTLWHYGVNHDVDENESQSEEEDGEILLFAMPEADRARTIQDQPASDNDSRLPQTFDGKSQTQANLDKGIDDIVQYSTHLPELLVQWTRRSTCLLGSLEESVSRNETTAFEKTCLDMKTLAGEMLRTLELTKFSIEPNVVAGEQLPRTFHETTIPWQTQYRKVLAAASKLDLTAHATQGDWADQDASEQMLSAAKDLHQLVIDFAREAAAIAPSVGLFLPAVLPGRMVAGGWAGNGLRSGQGNIPPQQVVSLSSDTVAELESYAAILRTRVKGCRLKLKQYERECTLAHGSMILRDSMDMLGTMKHMLEYCEQIDLSPLEPQPGSTLPRSPTISDFVNAKQLIYDASGILVGAAQSLTLPAALQASGSALTMAVATMTDALSGLELSLQTTLMHAEFVVQEFVTRYLPVEPEQGTSEAALDYGLSTRDGRVKKFFGEVPEPQVLLGGTPSLDRIDSFGRPTGTTALSAIPASQDPWFLDHELGSDLAYDSKGNVKAGTLLALVERLTRHDLLDAVFNNTFLLTYRSFTSAEELSSLLMQRFIIEPPPGLTPSQIDMWIELKQGPIQLRVFNIFKSWMENFFMEPPTAATREWLTRMKHFVRSVMAEHIATSPILIKLIEKRIVQGDAPVRKLVPNTTGQMPTPIIPRNLKKLRLLDIDPLEVARQLTIMESNLYNKIKPIECLDKSWSKADAAEGAENIKAMILHSNQITAWVAEAILYQTDLKKRVNLIKHFVFIAEKCRTLNNFSTLTAIISGLNSAPIHRLRRTWDLLNARVAMSAEDLNRLMNSSKNFSKYREALHQTQPPCVPFLGVYLTDLTFIEDGNPNMSTKARHLINISKRQKTADVIREIQQYQAMAYSLQPVAEIQNYIRSCMDITRDISELYNISLEREPREREDEKIARLLQESGFL